jgi:hypothetical protein
LKPVDWLKTNWSATYEHITTKILAKIQFRGRVYHTCGHDIIMMGAAPKFMLWRWQAAYNVTEEHSFVLLLRTYDDELTC